ncbi:unnamed protein product, partial [Acanthoscelides obtectus]
ENVDAVRKLIIEDRHVTYREIEAKLVSRWIPHLLTEEQKAARVNCCQKTLDRFNSGNSKNVYSIVSGDESWIYCYEPENKRESAVWVFEGEEKPKKVIRSRSVSKKMVATFVSNAGHIATISLNEQRTVTADWYTTICLPKVITELRKINLERRIILHQDNASSHTAQKTRQYLTEENVELLDHPPYMFQSPEEAVDAFKNAVLDLSANELNKYFENAIIRRMELNREHFRAIIYYNFQRQLSQQECLAELLSVFGNETPHQSTISRCLSDDPRLGAPKTAVTQENVDAVRNLIIADRNIARLRLFRWIPHLLTEEQKAARVNCIVSGDESWIYCYEPENKRQSALWVFQGEEKPTKVIRSRSVSKKMVATFVSIIPLNEQRTVTADWYTTICLPKYLTEENLELSGHPPYSPDLSPNDFFTFPKIKNRLRSQRFQSPEEAWSKCFENWFERMQMCINLRGEYFEKQ